LCLSDRTFKTVFVKIRKLKVNIPAAKKRTREAVQRRKKTMDANHVILIKMFKKTKVQ
jgi:hypothetical protein